MFYVYILKSKKNGNIYTGYSNDLKRRLIEHNSGHNVSTKPYIPYELIYYEAYRSEGDAKEREQHLKINYRTAVQLKNRLKRSLA
ncbi:MAG: Excinuclease subunit domain protein [Candidatus Nomurabacteria bacterium]|nr:Excinuclease subunit domain protein [Candidatus Nomurabacteria bacterium]